jgi:hypothetical protein
VRLIVTLVFCILVIKVFSVLERLVFPNYENARTLLHPILDQRNTEWLNDSRAIRNNSKSKLNPLPTFPAF